MSELNGPNFGVNKINFHGVQKQSHEASLSEQTETNAPKLTDFSDPRAEALGRSQVRGADNINTDLKALLENPQVAENSDKMFEAAYKAAVDAGLEHPYEKVSEFATGKMG